MTEVPKDDPDQIATEQGLLRRYRRNAMKADFSWEKTVDEYLRVYELAANYRGGSI